MNSALLTVAVLLGAPGPKDAKAPPLVGTWLIVTHTQDGKTSDVKGDHCWTFTSDGKRGGHTLDTTPTTWQKYEMDEKSRPSAFVVTHEYRAGPTYQSFLFEVDGDELIVCTGDRDRPKSITAEAGSGNHVYKLRRVKGKN
jgi:uncharacterized protein (TIGR03067 family)